MSIAFVAGATGYTGREVVRQLALRGVETWAHVRPESSKLEEWRGRFTELRARTDATPWDAKSMTTRLTELSPTHVFALLGTTRKRGAEARKSGKDETYESVDYGLTALLFQAAEASGARPRVVYLSSAGVNASTSNAYLEVRWRAEEVLRKTGLPYAIARPSFITGPDRDETRVGERVGSVVADGALSMLGVFGARKLRERYRSTTNTTLATALVRLALDDVTNRVFESEDLR